MVRGRGGPCGAGSLAGRDHSPKFPLKNLDFIRCNDDNDYDNEELRVIPLELAKYFRPRVKLAGLQAQTTVGCRKHLRISHR